MKHQTFTIFLAAIALVGNSFAAGEGDDSSHDSELDKNTVTLDAIGVANLGIETEEVLEEDFESTVFSLGRIEVIPTKRAVVSSRISGRVMELLVQEGDTVEKDQVVARVESRQPGDPPPVIALKAPLGGLVSESHASLGEPIEPENDVLHITDLSEVYAVASVPEDQAGRLEIGMPAYITVAALPGETFEGEMLRFGTAADRAGGTLDAVFRLENSDGKLRPGMRAEFSIVVSSREFVMAVPRSALQGDPSNRFVYAVRIGRIKNAFVKSPVQVGEQNDRYVEIINGLFPGDEVVVKGAYMLSFAGKGTVSLKDALDEAHGHEHNEDGSEMTAADKAKKKAEEGGADGHAHGGGGTSVLTYVFGATTAILLGLLLVGGLKRGGGEHA